MDSDATMQFQTNLDRAQIEAKLRQLKGIAETSGQGEVAAAFLVGYGTFRFIAEYFREPDAFLGILSLGMSMGQWLCVPMIVAGVLLWMWARRQPARVAPAGRRSPRRDRPAGSSDFGLHIAALGELWQRRGPRSTASHRLAQYRARVGADNPLVRTHSSPVTPPDTTHPT